MRRAMLSVPIASPVIDGSNWYQRSATEAATAKPFPAQAALKHPAAKTHRVTLLSPAKAARLSCPLAVDILENFSVSKKSIDFPLGEAVGLSMTQRPSELAERISNLRKPTDRIMRETFRLPVEAARVMAREIIRQAPRDGYIAVVEQWRPLPNGQIELTTRRLRAAE
jgi:hypothetical protein